MLIQYQFLQSNIISIIKWTVRRIFNEIIRVKGLKGNYLKKCFRAQWVFNVIGYLLVIFHYVSFSIAIFTCLSKAMKPEPPAFIWMTTKFLNQFPAVRVHSADLLICFIFYVKGN